MSSPLSNRADRAAAAALWAARLAEHPLPPAQIPPCALCRAYLEALARRGDARR